MALTFAIVARVCVSMSGGGTSPVPGFRGPTPERKRRLPTRRACGYGPTGGGAFGVTTTSGDSSPGGGAAAARTLCVSSPVPLDCAKVIGAPSSNSFSHSISYCGFGVSSTMALPVPQTGW